MENTKYVTKSRPANFVPITRVLRDDEPPIPEHVRRRAQQELTNAATHEWQPLYPFEQVEATLVKKTPMRLGGTAYLLADVDNGNGVQESLNPIRVLLKRGGVILDAALADVPEGTRLFIRYLGELEAKPDQNPARDWYALKVSE